VSAEGLSALLVMSLLAADVALGFLTLRLGAASAAVSDASAA
jgi:hypothetical protein